MDMEFMRSDGSNCILLFLGVRFPVLEKAQKSVALIQARVADTKVNLLSEDALVI
jgi:hypothetical protein